MKKTISTEKLHTLRNGTERFLLIDLLGKDEFAKDHIPGARNVPADTPEFAKAIADKAAGSKTRRMVLYGRGNGCELSAKACRLLTTANFTHVIDYEGGLAAWNESKRARLAARAKATS
jgi:rhodanese-related sulfurtransferase